MPGASSRATSPVTRSRRTALAAAAAAAGLVIAGAVAAPATASLVPGRPAVAAQASIVVEDGVTQPVFPVEDAIIETVFVETKVDTDQDGELDLVGVRIERPDAGGRVASIVTASPYWDCCQSVANHPVDFPRLPQEEIVGRVVAPPSEAPADGLPGSIAERRDAAQAEYLALREQFLARGYAMIQAQTVGTSDSDGCPTSGDRDEMLSARATIDWIAGNARAYDADGDLVEATWATGKSAMIGVSYNGTLPTMVATAAPKGLKTIVPIAAISSWYEYYRANGLVVAPGGYQGEDADVLARFVISDEQKAECEPFIQQMFEDQDRGTGDYNRFWKQRDYLPKVDKIKASVFVVHGLNDWNVKTENAGLLWDALGETDLERKIWWHQGGHGSPGGDTSYELPDGTVTNYSETVDRWMDHYLYKIDNGADEEPQAIVQRENLDTTTEASWPAPGTEDRTYRLSTLDGAATDTGSGVLTTGAVDTEQARQRFVDDGRTKTAEVLVQSPGSPNPNRLAYRTDKLDEPTRLSGRAEVTLRLAVDTRKDANVTALLVDYRADGTAHIVTRGWIDPHNRESMKRSIPLERGKLYDLAFGLQPDDYVFAAGSRIGLVVISTDRNYTIRPDPGTKLSLAPGGSSITLPVVGG